MTTKPLILIIGLVSLVAQAEPIKPPTKIVTVRPVTCYEIVKFTNSLTGRDETGVLRLDKLTGATWILEDGDVNGTTNGFDFVASKAASKVASH